ncbi:hypothetical protein GDO78_005790 [Eleutherodactylus coqui]|uniref:Secreted protein n=1 Tax=Eleutherodactylus coqui TaxID=57060 RepID=A0A8J6KDL6_ELECQ|nr:hypothetical protein GDO78_005790 [Eleutherodactylus coqui]
MHLYITKHVLTLLHVYVMLEIVKGYSGDRAKLLKILNFQMSSKSSSLTAVPINADLQFRCFQPASYFHIVILNASWAVHRLYFSQFSFPIARVRSHRCTNCHHYRV